MSKVQKAKALIAGLAVLFLMNSCVEFFSTSWGEVFKRDTKNVKVTTGNVDALLDAAKGDRDLSKAILDKIAADPNADDTLKRAAIKAANQAVDIGSLFLENAGSFKDIVDGTSETGLQDIADKFLKDLESRDIDVKDIGEKTTGILKDKVEIKPVADKVVLGSAGPIEVPVSTTDGGTGTITVNVNANGTGTAVINVGGSVPPVTYPCTVNEDGTITLTGAGTGNVDVDLGYEIDDDEGTLKLTDLDDIKNVGLAETGTSAPASVPSFPGMPVFEEDFIDDTVTESDLTLLVMTLVLAKAEKDHNGDLEAYLEVVKGKNLETGEELDEDEKVIAAVINTMLERGDDTSELTNNLKELLGMED